MHVKDVILNVFKSFATKFGFLLRIFLVLHINQHCCSLALFFTQSFTHVHWI